MPFQSVPIAEATTKQKKLLSQRRWKNKKRSLKMSIPVYLSPPKKSKIATLPKHLIILPPQISKPNKKQIVLLLMDTLRIQQRTPELPHHDMTSEKQIGVSLCPTIEICWRLKFFEQSQTRLHHLHYLPTLYVSFMWAKCS